MMDTRLSQALALNRGLIERTGNAGRHYAYMGNGFGVAQVLGTLRMCVNTEDYSLAPCLIMDGYWESWVTKAFAMGGDLSGKVVLDIGANHGYYALIAAKLGASLVVAYEPQAKLAECIRRSVFMNGVKDVLMVQECAVGESFGTASICLPTHGVSQRGSAFLQSVDSELEETLVELPWSEEEDTDPGLLAHRIDTCRVEPLSPELLMRADIVKIDAEGFEQKIWRGAPFEKMKSGSVVFLEYTACSYEANFAEEIEKSGFEIGIILPDGSRAPFTAESCQKIPEFEMLWLVKK